MSRGVVIYEGMLLEELIDLLTEQEDELENDALVVPFVGFDTNEVTVALRIREVK